MMCWTKEELMIAAAADVIKDHDIALVGIGLPNLAAMLAKQTHAPNLKLIYESGAIDASPENLPQGPGDFPLLRTSVMNTSLFDALGYVQRGKVDIAFLAAAEIDQYGNLNATVVGDYLHPICRLPGSGGANDMGSGAKKIVVVSKHIRRKFPERVSFITTPGFINVTSINRSPLCHFLVYLSQLGGVPNFHFSCNLIQKTVLSNCFRIHLAVQNENSMRQRGSDSQSMTSDIHCQQFCFP